MRAAVATDHLPIEATELSLPAPTALSPDETPFYIPATGPSSRPRRTLKQDDTFIVVDSHGDIGASSGGPDGIFNKDTRYLSRLELLINGMAPLLLGSHVRDDNAMLTVDVTNPDTYAERRLVFPKDTLHIVRTYFVRNDCVYVRFGIQNHASVDIGLAISISFANDFADLFEVRGMHRKMRGKIQEPAIDAEGVILRYLGLDQVERTTSLQFDPVPDALDSSTATYNLVLRPAERRSYTLTIGCDRAADGGRASYVQSLAQSARALRRHRADAIAIGTSSDVFNEVLSRSLTDLYMLTTNTAQGRYPYAGIPWYSTSFGRDGLITALHMLWCDPGLAKGVLMRLAALQSTTTDALNDAEPGKILHEMRGGEMASLREVPFKHYYGSIDSTPLFVLLAGAYAERTGDYDTLRRLWPNVLAALDWIDGPGDRDRDGFVEYSRATTEGLANQGWKDSYDSVFHADGRLAEGPIALAEVQAYVFAAKKSIALCAHRLGHAELASRLEVQATELADRFETSFWCEELGTYAIALDGMKMPCRIRSSNAGHVLYAGLARPDRARLVANSLLSSRFMSGFGIRTIAVGESRYNPMSYHNGSIWPHDNALIAMGLSRYGFKEEANAVFSAIATAASYMELRRLPELFCGFRRVRAQAPTLYPVACSPQAWASSTPFALLQASLGLEFRPDEKRIVFRNPVLPPFLDMLVLRNLALGEASVDLGLSRYGDQVSLQILRTSGHIETSLVMD